VMSPEAARRPDLGRCTERSHTEGIERRCARDGSRPWIVPSRFPGARRLNWW
jgi:hypothetical protein